MPYPILSDIYLYPVKSLAGIKVSKWPVTAKGLLYDRKWMLIDSNNQFLNQRQLPKMALIQTQLTHSELILSTDSTDSISLPINATTGNSCNITIWGDTCMAKKTSLEVNQRLSDFLNIQCQLVYQPDDVVRPVDPNYSKKTDHINFSDGFPFLLTSEASMTALNKEMNLELSIERFRPNLVISQCKPYAEDSWRKISINNIDFRLPKPCSRCAIPTVDPTTANTGKEPLRTLNRLRKWNKQVYFGQNVLHDQSGELSIGSEVHIIRTGQKQPPL
ncbi:MAG: MOSC domain-containing protein [Methylococcales symbiont of Iophon sp. n. MRB-2018]|nr:MAG: MOSC domain-containing protein [Methylococcales symbiont of Iophon sp. n. MRB-2018]KAF3980464.1 MAG: MOSC domain-containing protein [Methylococcales symbiont of Iophon sp. n. MRB-2018]